MAAPEARKQKGWQLNNRDHRKLLLIDGRVAIVGGINISRHLFQFPATCQKTRKFGSGRHCRLA